LTRIAPAAFAGRTEPAATHSSGSDVLPAAPPQSLRRLLRGCPALAASLRGVERAAATDAPLLILGEAGTGRSTLARALHAASRRAAGPLVEVDPGALPSALFESEFFGHRPGAFTGAAAGLGRVARAGGGTLVLDHVEELPLASQPKLLRLLAERRYAPLGGEDTAADARFIAIGPEDLTARVARGTFRADLYYRLEVVALRLPPLRERRPDLPALFEDLLADLGERFGRPGLRLAPRARAWMQEYPWPGNLRQLRNLLERSLVLGGATAAPPPPDRTGAPAVLDPPPPEAAMAAAFGATATAAAAGTRALAAASAVAPAAGSAAPAPAPAVSVVPVPGGAAAAQFGPRPLIEVEREEILRALAYTRGHQGRAATLLGISRKALWEKRRRYGIP
jgi:sigma-54 specific flagellar transcriptional regulator A